MQLIKLDAIDSTNDFLKNLSTKSNLENFTVVSAESQTKGRGQMGTSWNSESGKNLTISLLIKEVLSDIDDIYVLNTAVALGVINSLKQYDIPKLAIKWPNDILSDNKKIGGILIENAIKNNGSIVSVVGLGLNVNQMNYENLPKASSLAIITGSFYDKEILLEAIVSSVKLTVKRLSFEREMIWQEYQNLLYKKGIPMPFESKGSRFMGIITGVDKSGKLQLLLEDDTIKLFEIKELQMLY